MFSFFIFSHSWAFGKLTQQLTTTFQKYNYNKNSTNISLFFENQSISDNINSIKLKKTIAKELLKKFRVIDPVFTQQIANQNKWKKKDFLEKKNRIYFFQKTNSHVLIYTELTENKQKIFTLHTIFQTEKGIIAKLHQSFQKEPFLKTKTTKKKPPEKPLFAVNSNEFFSQTSLEDIIPTGIQEEPQDNLLTKFFPTSTRKNTNWIVHQPTAFFIQGHTIHQRFSIHNLELVRLQPNFFRYSYGYVNFEVSVNVLEQANKIDHSYLRIKTLLYNQDSISPLFTIAGGLRTRLYRNNDEQPTQNQLREDLSFFLALSGYPQTYILYNFYLDNYSTGVGAKLFLEKKLRLFFDSRIDYQQNNPNQYYSLGLEHFPSDNVGYNLSFSNRRNNIVQVRNAPKKEDHTDAIDVNFSIIFNF